VTLGGVLQRNEWERTLKELKEDNVRGLPQSHFHDPERKKKKKQRTKKQRREAKTPRPPSWIWLAQGQAHDPADGVAMNEGGLLYWGANKDTDLSLQRFVSNGRRPARVLIDGARRWICWRRRWRGCPGTAPGDRCGGRGGRVNGTATRRSWRERRHMQCGRPQSKHSWPAVLSSSGRIYLRLSNRGGERGERGRSRKSRR
jgi:hypothetical protein